MSGNFKKAWNIVTTVLVVITVLAAVLLMGSRLLGYRCFNVISGSMAPEYPVGSLIFVKPTDPLDVEEGEDITFVLDEKLTVATHRVVRIDTEKQHFYTKGLTNDTEDAPVHFKNLIGVPTFCIPLVGYVSDFIQNPPGMYITLAVAVILILLVFLPDFIGKNKILKKEEETNGSDGQLNSLEEENKKLKEELLRLQNEVNEKSSNEK